MHVCLKHSTLHCTKATWCRAEDQGVPDCKNAHPTIVLSHRQTQSTAAWSVGEGVLLMAIRCADRQWLHCYSFNPSALFTVQTW